MGRDVGEYRICFLDTAIRNLRHLHKKYPNVERDIRGYFEGLLKDNSHPGTPIKGAGKYRKLRIASSDIGEGKRAGFRIVLQVCDKYSRILIIFVYAKKQRGNLLPHDIKSSIRQGLGNIDLCEQFADC